MYNTKTVKFVCLFVCLFVCPTIAFSQSIRVIDNKGTIKSVHNNNVTTSNTAPTSPLENDVWFHTSTTSPTIVKIYDGTNWKGIAEEHNATKVIILNRESPILLTSSSNPTNSWRNLPVNNSHVMEHNTNYFQILANGRIRILKDGVYMISGEISVTNMPSGDTKYILGLFVNGIRRGYLSRGFASLPSADYWGTTGVIMYKLNADDEVDIRYVLNANSLNSNFLNIGIKKI